MTYLPPPVGYICGECLSDCEQKHTEKNIIHVNTHVGFHSWGPYSILREYGPWAMPIRAPLGFYKGLWAWVIRGPCFLLLTSRRHGGL